MKEDLKKFEELMRTNSDFQEKLKAALADYSGEVTMEAVFEDVLKPLAGEYGISGSFEEFKEYLDKIQGEDGIELNSAELAQVAGGGKGGGIGAVTCLGIGIGGGGAGGTESGGFCIGIGGGYGSSECLGTGTSQD